MSITTTIHGGAVQLSGNPVWIQCTGGAAPAGASDYKILLRVISQDSKLYGAPFEDACEPDESGGAWFNISGYVHQPIDLEFDYPLTSPHVAYPNRPFNIQVQAGESYFDQDGILQESWGTASAVFQILRGGMQPRQISMMEAEASNFYDTYIADGKFLTPRPWGDFVHPAQPVKLWFMTIADKAVTWYVKGYYNDGTFETFSESFSMAADSLYEFNCNPVHRGLELEPEGKKMTHFDVWIESGGQVISDARRFTYNWSYCERPVFFLVANSYGGIDDIYFSGNLKEGIRTEGTTVYKPQQRGANVFTATRQVPDKQGVNTWEVNSGFKTPSEMLFMRDLVVGKNVWMLYPNNGVSYYFVIPVIITSSRIELIDRGEDLYSMTIEVEEAHESPFTFDNRIW